MKLPFAAPLLGILAVALPGATEAQAQTPAQARCPWPAPPGMLDDRPSLPDSALIESAAGQVKLCYSRPSARGREIFGGLVRYDRPWRTGANEPTMLHLPADAVVGGVELPAGMYVLTTIPTPEAWTFVFNTTTETEPGRMLNALDEFARAELPVQDIPDHVETFTVRASDDAGASALVFEWEHTRVVLPIEVRP